MGAAPRTDDEGQVDAQRAEAPGLRQRCPRSPRPAATRARWRLAVAAREKALEPGGQTVIDVALTDAAGRAVSGGEVAVVVVDEAVLALTGYRLPDPVAVFYARATPAVERPSPARARRAGAAGGRARRSSRSRSRPWGTPQAAPRDMAPWPRRRRPRRPCVAKSRNGRMAATRRKRRRPSRCAPTSARWRCSCPAVVTDAAGKAHVPIEAARQPDPLPRDGGGGRRRERSSARASPPSPRACRSWCGPSPPRFLNFGDRFELPVVLQNQTDAPATVDVAVRAANAELTAGRGPARHRPRQRPRGGALPGRRRSARAPRASRSARGRGRLDRRRRVRAAGLDAGHHRGLRHLRRDRPGRHRASRSRRRADVVPQFGGLEVTTSSTALQALTDAVLYLVRLPLRVRGAARLARAGGRRAASDVLTAFQAEGLPDAGGDGGRRGPRPGAARAACRTTTAASPSGAAATSRGRTSASTSPTRCSARKEKGFDGPRGDARAGAALPARRSRRTSRASTAPDVRRTLIAYALYVRARMGDARRRPARARWSREAGVEGALASRRSAGCCRCCPRDRGSQAEVDADPRATSPTA